MKRLILLVVIAATLLSCKESKEVKNFYKIPFGDKTFGIGVEKNLLKLSYRNEDNEALFTDLVDKNITFDAASISDKLFQSDYYEVSLNDGITLNMVKSSDKIEIKYETDMTQITFKDSAHLYGLGERYGKLNLLDENIKYKIVNEHKYSDRAILPIPVVYDDNGNFVYFASPYKATITVEKSGNDVVLLYINGNKEKSFRGVDIYVSDSQTLIDSVSEYQKLVGLPPLPPKWLFGYIQSKYGYFSIKQTLDIAKKFNELGLPATGIVLDLYWFKYMGDIDWNYDNFEDPVAFIKELDTLGFKLINISEPFFDKNSKNFNYFKSMGYFGKNKDGKIMNLKNWWGEGAVFDYTNPAANFSLWNKSYKPLMNQGIGGLWTDLGEPEGVYHTTRFKMGIEDDIHNQYNYYWSKMLYENIKREYPDRRPVILSRSGWASSPKLGVSIWSGDAEASWKGFKIQPFIMTSASLSGFSYWASDVGGFVGEGTPHLFTKWNEFGLFSPIYRPHGSGVDREPWSYEGAALEDVAGLLKLRAQFLPYIYSTAYSASFLGIPFIRPIDVANPALSNEERIEFENQEYFFGKSILYRQTYENDQYNVYLPNKGEWIDLKDNKTYCGGEIHSITYKRGEPSYFLKPNGIFIMNSKSDYQKIETLDVYINSINNGSEYFYYYDDDGITTEYLKDKYNLIKIENIVSEDKIIIKLTPEKLNLKENLPSMNFKVYSLIKLKGDSFEAVENQNENSYSFSVGNLEETKIMILKKL
ncbi:MAG TPA: glycoside hydrolase family 31 protein [Spirochaetota bacterium]|nr:glycoside hydrolase family 31 protein [Spirochaetota bacterium]HOS33425.1 glycoside hydrolase family 31 protein [Spirochaetota bacterium]HOS55921.1 glycoside hydrolase family 31 protein [Spirochaetota bacterium]HRU42975.1 glycoside hydrolase family 31 protein [Spirochaetota bacterium]